MTATKGIEFEGRFFSACDVAAGVFLKYLIDEAEASEHAHEPWLSKAVSSWRVQAAITEFGLILKEEWSSAQRVIFVKLAETACKKLEIRESIPAKEIASWPMTDKLRIFPRSATEVLTVPIIELGRAIIALVSGNLPRSPKRRSLVLWNTYWPVHDTNGSLLEWLMGFCSACLFRQWRWRESPLCVAP